MSTNWAFECLSHDPPVWSEYFTSHTHDLYFKTALKLAARRPLLTDDEIEAQGCDAWTNSNDLRDNNARSFLLEHPDCNLGLVNEYDQHEDISKFLKPEKKNTTDPAVDASKLQESRRPEVVAEAWGIYQLIEKQHKILCQEAAKCGRPVEQLRDSLGNWPLNNLLLAKAQILNTIAQLENKHA